MKNLPFHKKALGAALLLIASPLTMAACDEPVFELEIPDGRSASEGEMVRVQQEVNTFISDAEGYIACIEESETANLAERLADNMLDEMQNLAARFNRQLRYFKRRNS